MNRWMYGLTICMGMAAIACGGGNQAAATTPTSGAAATSEFGPLGVGSDWQSYTKLNSQPVESEDHGKRFVDTYVNDVGLAAYKDADAEVPVGTVIVKTSWERNGDQPSQTPGPIFVMEKRAPGFDADNGDWYYAIHWENPPEPFRKRFGGPIYWQSPSKRVDYCKNCHNGYDRQLGEVPEEFRNW